MRAAAIIILFIFFGSEIFPQVYDSFADGDFTSNPVWGGDTGDWEIAQNSSAGTNGTGTTNTLRLAAQLSQAGTKYLSSQKTGSWGTEQSWSFWLGRRNSTTPSASNQSIFWLWANESVLTSGTINGYRIVFGDDDGGFEIFLEKVVDGVASIIITSGNSTVEDDDISLLIRVTRNSSSVWNLYTSVLPAAGGEGPAASEIPSSSNTNMNQGSTTDNTFTSFDNGYLGIMAIHSLGINPREAAEFDQIYFDTDASSPLPVELLNFNSKIINGKVLLTWETATELNNYGFEIQKNSPQPPPSRNNGEVQGGGNFFYNWKTIGFVNGHGNSNSNKTYNFTDNSLYSGENFYRLKQIDFDGQSEYSKIISVLLDEIPDIKLEQNFPNPFNPSTKIRFTIPDLEFHKTVSINIYNSLGEKIIKIFEGEIKKGIYEIEFNGSDLTSGIYYYKFESNNFSQTKKMLLIK